MIYMAPKS